MIFSTLSQTLVHAPEGFLFDADAIQKLFSMLPSTAAYSLSTNRELLCLKYNNSEDIVSHNNLAALLENCVYEHG
jgi:hypothetical protein